MRKYKPKGFWNDYNNCYAEAKKYSTRSEFALGNNRAYMVAKTNGWLKDYTWFVSRAALLAKKLTKWDYDACYIEAKKYVTRGGFQKGSRVAYWKSRKEGWLKDYNWFVSGRKILAQKRTKWTYESCYNEAKKYTIASNFQRGSGGAYNAARENGWLKDYIWFEVKQHHLTYEYCRDCALQCKTRTEFSDAFGSAYNKSRKMRWLEDFDWLERRLNPFVDKIDHVYGYFWEKAHRCYIGRSIDVKRRDWQHRNFEKSTPFRMSREIGLPIPQMKILESGLSLTEGLKKEDDYCKKFEAEGWFVGNISPTGIGRGSIGLLGAGKWTEKNCREESLKYKTVKQFREMSYSAYVTARRKGWLYQYEWLSMSRHKAGFWNYKTCYNEARKYHTANGFQSANGSAYNVARENGWLKNYTWFIDGRKEHAKARKKWDEDSCYKEALNYKTIRRFRQESNGAYKTACRYGWIDDYEWLTREIRRKGLSCDKGKN